MKRILKIKTGKYIKRLLYRLIKYIKTKNVKNGPNSITQSEAPEPEEIVVHKLQTDISALSESTGETSSGLTEVTRATPKKKNRKKEK